MRQFDSASTPRPAELIAGTTHARTHKDQMSVAVAANKRPSIYTNDRPTAAKAFSAGRQYI